MLFRCNGLELFHFNASCAPPMLVAASCTATDSRNKSHVRRPRPRRRCEESKTMLRKGLIVEWNSSSMPFLSFRTTPALGGRMGSKRVQMHQKE